MKQANFNCPVQNGLAEDNSGITQPRLVVKVQQAPAQAEPLDGTDPNEVGKEPVAGLPDDPSKISPVEQTPEGLLQKIADFATELADLEVAFNTGLQEVANLMAAVGKLQGALGAIDERVKKTEAFIASLKVAGNGIVLKNDGV